MERDRFTMVANCDRGLYYTYMEKQKAQSGPLILQNRESALPTENQSVPSQNLRVANDAEFLHFSAYRIALNLKSNWHQ